MVNGRDAEVSVLGRTGTTGAGRGKVAEGSGPQFIQLHLHTGGACAQSSKRCQPRAVSGICPSRGLLCPRAPRNGSMAPAMVGARGRQRQPGSPTWGAPWSAKGLGTSLGLGAPCGRGCLVAVGYRPHLPRARCPSHSLSAPTTPNVRVVSAVLCQALQDAGAGAWSTGSRMDSWAELLVLSRA